MHTLSAQAGDALPDKKHKKRMAVLAAAARLFNQNGYDRTSIDDIAAALNVTKRTLYYYVNGKEEILFECHNQAMILMTEPVENSRDTSRPVLDRITALLQGYMVLIATDFGACLAKSEEYGLSDESRQTLRKGRRGLDECLRALIREGIADGVIAPCDPVMASAMIFGAFNQVPRWFRHDGALSHEDLADHYITMMLNGLKSR